uniref:peroxidase n=1 Tax=Ditylenchus dipsaci TaxID=166011 RepID=A0A915CRG8_9BILA
MIIRTRWKRSPILVSSSSHFVIVFLLLICIQQNTEADDDNPVTRNFKCRLNGCCDQHEWCRFWASMGECSSNRNWMNRNCQLACNSCDQAPVRRPANQNNNNFALAPAASIPVPTPPVRRPIPVASPPPPTSPPPTLPPVTRRPNIPFAQPPRRPQLHFSQSRPPLNADPSLAAEVLLRERLVFATEDTSGRRSSLSAEKVVRSNIANACVPRLDEAECERSLCYNLYFRTMDGTCNNFRQPLRGAAFRPYSRLMPPDYDNGLSEPVSSIRNIRPTAREANRAILSSAKSVLNNEFNALLMQFGQFMSHDMAKTTLVPSAKCNICQNIPGRCMAIFLTPQDPNSKYILEMRKKILLYQFQLQKNTCIRVSRSSPICGSGRSKPRQQLNENTGFIDGSPIYGSSVDDLSKFREGRTGMLKLQSFNGQRLLPFDQTKCKNSAQCTATFVAGDSRVNLFLGLSSYHLLFTREHNRIAARLQRLNPQWNGDRIFQEARKIVGAQIQAICYRSICLKCLQIWSWNDTGILPKVRQSQPNHTKWWIQLVDGTLHSDRLIFQGGVDPIIRGMMSTPLKRPQRLTRTITEQMFGSTDLGSINIQRGRDHGLPSYMRFRQLCGLPSAQTFEQLSKEILSPTARANLQRAYRSPEFIDFYVGGLLEDPVVRGLVGPTVACVVGPQFARTRDGDRFYFENPGIFTRAQLAEIRRSSLSRIICDNGDNINSVPREAFRTFPVVSCNEIPQMDLNRWKE